MASDYAASWEKTKKDFEAQTGKKKPKESKGIFNAFGSYTGLSGSLKECDKASDTITATIDKFKGDPQGSKEILKMIDGFAKEAKKFSAAKDGYVKVLDKEMQKEFALRPEKDLKSLYEKCLKSLKKDLDALDATIQSKVGGLKVRIEQAGSAGDQMRANFDKNWDAVMARAKAAAGKVKTDPTAKTWNSFFPKAARDVNMQLAIAKTIPGWKVEIDPLVQRLVPYANQGGGVPSHLPEDADKDTVMGHLKDFIAQCKHTEGAMTK